MHLYDIACIVEWGDAQIATSTFAHNRQECAIVLFIEFIEAFPAGSLARETGDNSQWIPGVNTGGGGGGGGCGIYNPLKFWNAMFHLPQIYGKEEKL